MREHYTVNEVFCSLQGEGVRAGTLNVFVRFTGCNLACTVETHGFDCDTEFASGRRLSAGELLEQVRDAAGQCRAVIFTGGEPALQLDRELVELFRSSGYFTAIETNGTKDVSGLGLDWVTCSPKVAEHAIRCMRASEVKYVRAHGQGIPRTAVIADHKLISPAFEGLELDGRHLAWCRQLIYENPEWRLSLQNHKLWKVR